jgi:hypothetical protein
MIFSGDLSGTFLPGGLLVGVWLFVFMAVEVGLRVERSFFGLGVRVGMR